MPPQEKAQYHPPWKDMSIIGIAGSSGSGKSSLAKAIVTNLQLPWVTVLSMDSFYKALDEEQNNRAHLNDFDFDSPLALDFDILVACLRELKDGRRTEVPRYSFTRHQRESQSTVIYSPHVLILEGILALHDPRVVELLDIKIFTEADSDVCLARRILRDVEERGRDIAGVIKQWLRFVKPNFVRFVEPQRKIADVIVPCDNRNSVATDMLVSRIRQTLNVKSLQHQAELERLGQEAEAASLSSRVEILSHTRQIRAMLTILQDPATDSVDFNFYLDRLSSLLVGRALDRCSYRHNAVQTPTGNQYDGLCQNGEISAVVLLRGGACLETGLRRVIPECRTGRLLIQSAQRTGEPELHYVRFPDDIAEHESVLLLDTQMSSGGAALMAVKAMVDHGVAEHKIILISILAGHIGMRRLVQVFPEIRVIVADVGNDNLSRWLETRYFGC